MIPKLPFLLRGAGTSAWYLTGPTRVRTPDGTWIASSGRFCRLTLCDQQTDTQTTLHL